MVVVVEVEYSRTSAASLVVYGWSFTKFIKVFGVVDGVGLRDQACSLLINSLLVIISNFL